jgi:sugar lactone lactonase YvrE
MSTISNLLSFRPGRIKTAARRWLMVLAAATPLCLTSPCLQAQPVYTFTTLAGPNQSPGAMDGFGTESRFYHPQDVAGDANGNIFVADSENHTIRKISPLGEVTTLAGLAGMAGTNDGCGAKARFYLPSGLCVDGDGNVFVADSGNYTIRKITPNGIVTTLAGSPGVRGTNDGIGGLARFDLPNDVAVSSNLLYIADTGAHTIRTINASGEVFTFAGLARQTGTNDGVGVAARFNAPQALCVGADGRVYVADRTSSRIRAISPGGVVSTFFISTNTFTTPWGVAVDDGGTIFVTTDAAIRQITSTGVSWWAGTNGGTWNESSGSQWADGIGTRARFWGPRGLAIVGGDLIVADYGNHTIRRVSGRNVTTIAGTPGHSSSSDVNLLASGLAARFDSVLDVALDHVGNVLVVGAASINTGAGRIRQVLPGGTVIDWATNLNDPESMVMDPAGNLYATEVYSHYIRMITSNKVVSVFAGSANASGTNDGAGSAARFNHPHGIALGPSGALYVADTDNHAIRKISSDRAVTTLAGKPGTSGYADGVGAAARFRSPYGLAVDASENVYVADTLANSIRRITPDGTVTTVAGGTHATGSTDGTGDEALFNAPQDIAVMPDGNLIVADTKNCTLRHVTPEGIVTTIGGLGLLTPGGTPLALGGDDGTGSTARFNYPKGVAVSHDGTIYVADAYNYRIRMGVPGSPDLPVVVAACATLGEPQQLDVTPRIGTNWAWRLVRRPSASAAELSSITRPNPVFTPDVSDLFVFQLRVTTSAGLQGVRNLELVASAPLSLKAALAGAHTQLTWDTVSGAPYQLEISSTLTNWTDWGATITGQGGLTNLLVPSANRASFFRLRNW